MKLIEGQLQFEEITCWDCKGTGKVTRHTLCNRYGMVNKGRPPCQCGAKNKDSHKAVGTYTAPCNTCEAKGTRVESEYDTLPDSIYKSLDFQYQVGGGSLGYIESLYGFGAVGGATDYGRMYELKDDKDKVIQKIKDGGCNRQAILFMKNGNFCKNLLVVVRKNDYSVYPKF